MLSFAEGLVIVVLDEQQLTAGTIPVHAINRQYFDMMLRQKKFRPHLLLPCSTNTAEMFNVSTLLRELTPGRLCTVMHR